MLPPFIRDAACHGFEQSPERLSRLRSPARLAFLMEI
jgi:hypothetical protein